MTTISNMFCGLSTPEDSLPRFGVEIEYEGIHRDIDTLHDLINNSGYWLFTEEPCLRDSGGEIIFSRPLTHRESIEALSAAFTKLQHAYVNHLTGMHVHLDFRKATLKQVHRFVVLYALFESALFSLSNKARHENIYCPSISSATGIIESLAPLRRDELDLDALCKYSPVNLACLPDKGSVELRIWESPTCLLDALRLLSAARHLYEYALSEKDIVHLLDMPADDRLQEVFSDRSVIQHIVDNGTYAMYSLNNEINAHCLLTDIKPLNPAAAGKRNTLTAEDHFNELLELARSGE